MLDAGIRDEKVLAMREPHQARGAAGFALAQLRVAARSGFSRRQVERAHAIARRGHLDQRAAAGQLRVVRMRGNRQDIEFHKSGSEPASYSY